jgi:SAM-dependent methyltransferase
MQRILCCPNCKSKIELLDGQFKCCNDVCTAVFPIIRGIPIIINDNNSLFKIEDYLAKEDNFAQFHDNKIKNLIKKIAPSISKNIKAKKNYIKFAELLLTKSKSPMVLVIGGRILGNGMESLLKYSAIELIEGDVAFGPRVKIIFDSHDIPFEDASFDGVVIQAVLEHVIDPYRCVSEIHRVLKKDGFVYAETPFMQQVHEGKYDFTRFTHIGHRRLFRNFEEIESGAVCGPGMALAWSYKSFLTSFTESKALKFFLSSFARCTSFPLKYFDYFLINKPGVLDSASGFYFIAQKSDKTISDKELINSYKPS